MAVSNIALKKPTTANRYVKPFEGLKAVDGVTAPLSRWLCNNVSMNNPGILAVDLQTISMVSSWTVKHMGAIAGWPAPNYCNSQFSFQVSSDNVNWITVDSVSNNIMGVTTRNLSQAVSCRFVRVVVSRGLNINPQIASIVDLEVYGYTIPLLSSLIASTAAGVMTLNPVFNPLVFNYTLANVPFSVSSINLLATALYPNSTIKINGVVVTGGSSNPVSLNVGTNNISVVVSNTDGKEQAYTVTVVREEGVMLTDLSASSGALSPSFSSGTLAYTTPGVGFDTTSITVTPTTTVAGATITVGGVTVASGQAATCSLNVGTNVINVVVTKGGASQTYTVTVVRASSPYLSNLQGIAGLTFVSTTLVYNLTVPNSTTKAKITPTAVDPAAKITVNGTTVASGASSPVISLAVGLNTITVVVTSAVGVDSRTYVLNVTRLA